VLVPGLSESGKFQSHAGSIEATLRNTYHTLYNTFQSHAGSIEARRPNRDHMIALATFQSHAGSIEAR